MDKFHNRLLSSSWFLIGLHFLLIFTVDGAAIWRDYEYSQHAPGEILHRHRRDTNSTGGFFDDPNNTAMYLVLPLLVFVYGGCACIYCCYKCRQYIEEKQPFTVLKLKLQGKSLNGILKRNEPEEPKPEDMDTCSNERRNSAQSDPDPEGTFDYINLQEEHGSTPSSPGDGNINLQEENGSAHSSPVNGNLENADDIEGDHSEHPLSITSSAGKTSQLSSADIDRRDSGIQDDRDGDIEKNYLPNSRSQSSKSFYSGRSLQSSVITAAYMNRVEDDSTSLFEIDEVTQSNVPPRAEVYIPPMKNAVTSCAMETQKSPGTYEDNDPSMKKDVTLNEANKPPAYDEINSPTSNGFTSSGEQNRKETKSSRSSFNSVNGIRPKYPDLINVTKTEHVNGKAGRQTPPRRHSSDAPNQETKVKHKEAKVIASVGYPLPMKTKKNKTKKKEPITKTSTDIQGHPLSIQNQSGVKENKSESDINKTKDPMRQINYLDNNPQINGRYRMYYQNNRLTQYTGTGSNPTTDSSILIPSVSGSISENKKPKPLLVGIGSDGDVKVTNNVRRFKIAYK